MSQPKGDEVVDREQFGHVPKGDIVSRGRPQFVALKYHHFGAAAGEKAFCADENERVETLGVDFNDGNRKVVTPLPRGRSEGCRTTVAERHRK